MREAPPSPDLAGLDVLVAGLFSAKRKDPRAVLEALAVRVEAHGARVVGHVLQRRGVSDGGVRARELPYSSATVLGSGKVREIAAECAARGIGAVVLAHTLTPRQRRALGEAVGCPVLGAGDLPDG